MSSNTSPDAEQPRFSKEEARQVFQRSFNDGSVILTKHARERMLKYDINTNDLLVLARSGIVQSEPECDIKTGEWTYRIESNNPKMKAVFIPMDNRVRVLTVMVD